MAFKTFKELQAKHVKGEDFSIEYRRVNSPFVACAIHGGWIEQGTDTIVKAISDKYTVNFYTFKGIMENNNWSLRIDSTTFDEPTGLGMVRESVMTLSVHGCAGNDRFTYVGGRDIAMAKKVIKSLVKYGFQTRTAMSGLRGLSTSNIVNKNSQGRGVQIEISLPLRRDIRKNSEILDRYITAIMEPILSSIK